MGNKDFWAIGETMTGDQFLELTNKSLVYGWFRGDECLYIGQTGNGFQRLIRHGIINSIEAVLPTDEIRLIPTFELADRMDLEETLIKRHQPRYNKRKNETYYLTRIKEEEAKVDRPKPEDVVGKLPGLYKVKSIYTPSQL